MRIKPGYKVRQMAGEHVVIMQGRAGSDMTRIISLNESSLYLWEAVGGKDFDADTVAALLTARYDVDSDTAAADARRWIDKLSECGLTE